MRSGDGIPIKPCLFDQSFLYEEGGDLLLTRFRGSRSKMSEYYTWVLIFINPKSRMDKYLVYPEEEAIMKGCLVKRSLNYVNVLG